MVRVLRYPRLCFAACSLAVCCAAARDLLASSAASHVLLYASCLLLPVCLVLLSCRVTVDAQGVGVGFLLRMRRTPWADIASLGTLCCNSRRLYLYGIYRGQTDFLNLLHHAPACGPWGFVVPLSSKLRDAIEIYCPFPVQMKSPPLTAPAKRLRSQWQQPMLATLYLFPCGAASIGLGVLLLLRATQYPSSALTLTLCAMISLLFGALLLRRCSNGFATCPAFSGEGIRVGRSLYLPWDSVRFGYVHRIARMSGLYLLSQPHENMLARNAAPVACLSMPDTSTLLLAYLTYCPHADRGVRP